MTIRHKGLWPLRERDDRPPLATKLGLRLPRMLFRLQEATHSGRADAPAFQRRARSRQAEGPAREYLDALPLARSPALHPRQPFQTSEFHDLDEHQPVSSSLPQLSRHAEHFGFILRVHCRRPNVSPVLGPPPPTANTRRHFPVKPFSYPMDHAHRASCIR